MVRVRNSAKILAKNVNRLKAVPFKKKPVKLSKLFLGFLMGGLLGEDVECTRQGFPLKYRTVVTNSQDDADGLLDLRG